MQVLKTCPVEDGFRVLTGCQQQPRHHVVVIIIELAALLRFQSSGFAWQS